MVDLILGLPPIDRIEVVGRCASAPKLTTFEKQRRDGTPFLRSRISFLLQHWNRRGHQSLRVWVDVWDATAEWLVAHDFRKGDAVWVAGTMLSRSARHGGPPGALFYWIHAVKLYFVPELPKAARDGDRYLISAEHWDRLSAIHNSSGPPEISMEAYQELLRELEESKYPMDLTAGAARDLADDPE